jgi:carboxymethylenebutenolidase
MLGDMSSTTVDIQTPDGVADAYLTRPDDDAPHPGVLFVMDIVGLRPRIEEMADRIAQRGYIVLAPNLFYRAGHASELPRPDPADPEGRAKFFQQIRPLAEQLTPEALDHDGGAYLDYLEQLAPGPVAITGYCMGARVGLRIAEAHPGRIAALGGFHGGGLVTDQPDSPHLGVGALKAELYFGHADQDQSNTPEQIAALDRALDEAGVRHRSEVYEGASHGYTMSDSAAYNEAAAERHFSELFALLDRTLAVPSGS